MSTTPSVMKAELSAKAALSGAIVPRVATTSGSDVSSASASVSTRTPAGRSPTSESDAANAPSTSVRRRWAWSRTSSEGSLARSSATEPGGGASGFASRRSARRSVYFQSSTRRWGRPLSRKLSNAVSRSALTSPSPGRLSRRTPIGFRECRFRGGLHRVDVRHVALTPHPDSRDSRSPRARARAPSRRISRCARARGRARGRGRCGSAGADNA